MVCLVLFSFFVAKRYIDGAIITRYSSENPLQPSAFIATTSEEILESKGSKYAPVQLSGTLRKALLLGKRYVIVGLPCHIQSVRKWAKIDSKVDKVIFAYFLCIAVVKDASMRKITFVGISI